MKVKIKSIEQKTWQDKSFHVVTIEGEEHDRSCWDGSVADWKVGEEYEALLTEKDKDGKKQYYIKKDQGQKQGGGYRGKSPEEQLQIIKMNVNTSASQIVCAFINAKVIKDPSEVAMAWTMFYRTGLDIVTGENK